VFKRKQSLDLLSLLFFDSQAIFAAKCMLIFNKSREWDLNPQAMVGDSIVYPTNQPWPLYKLHSLSFCRFIAFNDILLSKICSLMVCRNICYRLYSKVVFGISNYSLGQKYCRRCEVYMYNDSMFCPCCGMQLRLTPSSRRCKEILRKKKDIYAKG
jgi:hypothetical protein